MKSPIQKHETVRFITPGSKNREPGEGGKNPRNDLCPRFPPSLPAFQAEERRGFVNGDGRSVVPGSRFGQGGRRGKW